MKQKRFVSRVVSLIFLMSVLSMGNLFAQKAPKESPASDFKYDLNKAGDGVIILGYRGKGGDVVIPSEIEGLPVLEFSANSYDGFANAPITSIIFPDSITIIYADKTFVTKSLGGTEYSFDENKTLKKVVFPKKLKKIPDSMFYQCINLSDIMWPEDLEIIGTKDSGFLGAFEKTGVKEIKFPQTLKEIGVNSFSDCCKLTSVTFQDNIEIIHSSAFMNTSIKTFILPDSLKEIGYAAFKNCKELESITIGNGIEFIDDYAFADCKKLTTVNIPEKSISYTKKPWLRMQTYDNFSGCDKLGLKERKKIKDTGYKGKF